MYLLLRCVIYMAVIGMMCFPIGRLFALKKFQTDKFPFRQTEYEKTSGLYEKLKIQKWKNKIPDISRLFSRIVPKKQLRNSDRDSQKLSLMVNETCVAELTHYLLSAFGIALRFIWPGIGGAVLYFFYLVFGNLPFILVQRYNRPRLIKIHNLLLEKEQQKLQESLAFEKIEVSGASLYEDSYSELQ